MLYSVCSRGAIPFSIARHAAPHPLQQNDGTVEGRRYFLCEPNRGLFVRIVRCRTRAGSTTGDGRHVSFPSRTLANKANDEGLNTKLSNRNTPYAAAAHNAKNGSAPPYCSGLSRRDSFGLASGDIHQPPYERSAGVRHNVRNWVPFSSSENRCQGSRSDGIDAARHGIQLESDSSESSSSGSDRSQVTNSLGFPAPTVICGVSSSYSSWCSNETPLCLNQRLKPAVPSILLKTSFLLFWIMF